MCVPLLQRVGIGGGVVKGKEVGEGGGGGEERCRAGEERSEDRTDRGNGHFPRTNDECDEDTKDPESLPIG